MLRLETKMSNANTSNDCVLSFMGRKGLPMTRANYLYITYFGSPPAELGAELEAELPRQFRLGNDSSERATNLDG
jgi:hypothetical protein